MTAKDIADQVVQRMYSRMDALELADVLEAGMHDYDQNEPVVRLVNDALRRELERRTKGVNA